MMVQLAYFNVAIVASYALIVILARQIMLEIKRQSMNSKAQSMQAQISMTLFAQVNK
jgi:hypothetical protein